MKNSLLLFLLLATGCTTFQSRRQGTPPPIKRVLIVSDVSRLKPGYLSEMALAFPTSCTVNTLDVGPLSFGSPDSLIRAAAEKFRPDAILTIKQVPTKHIQRGLFFYRTVDDVLLDMVTYPDRKPFWKGITNARSLGRTPIIPVRLVTRLQQQGILGSGTGGIRYQ